MSENFRIDKGGLINRNKKISFKFNGKKYFGYEGDTLASALIANGVHLVGRSFKYHRPRGFFGAGVDEPYAIVQMNRNNEVDPNVRATEQELFEGLEAKSVNCWPNVDFDIGAINNFLGKFFPAGFYYKTFMWPKSFWYKIYEPIIRKAAGFGAASIKHDKEKYEHKYEYCDLLITGSGPSGLASAYAAAQNGAKVILAEDKSRFGGSLLTSEVTIGNQSGKEWAENIVNELKEMPNVIVKNRAQVFGIFLDGKNSQLPLVLGSIPKIELDDNELSEQLDKADSLIDIQITGNTNTEKAFNFFVSEAGGGFTEKQACGMIGNFMVESGANANNGDLNPSARSGFEDENSFGIAQWNPAKAAGNRFGQLVDFANQRNLNYRDIETQLKFVKFELETTPYLGLGKLRKTKTVKEATIVFQDKYERPNKDLAHTNQRVAFANEVYKKLGIGATT